MLEDEIFIIGVARLAVQKKTFSVKTEDVKHDTRACGPCGPLCVFLGTLRDDGLQINISEKNALRFRK